MRQKAIELLKTLPKDDLLALARCVLLADIQGDYCTEDGESVWVDSVQTTLDSLACGIRNIMIMDNPPYACHKRLKLLPYCVREAFAIVIETSDTQGDYDYEPDALAALEAISYTIRHLNG